MTAVQHALTERGPCQHPSGCTREFTYYANAPRKTEPGVERWCKMHRKQHSRVKPWTAKDAEAAGRELCTKCGKKPQSSVYGGTSELYRENTETWCYGCRSNYRKCRRQARDRALRKQLAA